jgi:hypothetical protein
MSLVSTFPRLPEGEPSPSRPVRTPGAPALAPAAPAPRRQASRRDPAAPRRVVYRVTVPGRPLTEETWGDLHAACLEALAGATTEKVAPTECAGIRCTP